MRSATMSNDGGDTQRAGKGQSHLPVFHFFSSLNGKFLLNSTNARIAMYKGTSLVDLMCQTAGDLVMSTKTIRRENELEPYIHGAQSNHNWFVTEVFRSARNQDGFVVKAAPRI